MRVQDQAPLLLMLQNSLPRENSSVAFACPFHCDELDIDLQFYDFVGLRWKFHLTWN